MGQPLSNRAKVAACAGLLAAAYFDPVLAFTLALGGAGFLATRNMQRIYDFEPILIEQMPVLPVVPNNGMAGPPNGMPPGPLEEDEEEQLRRAIALSTRVAEMEEMERNQLPVAPNNDWAAQNIPEDERDPITLSPIMPELRIEIQGQGRDVTALVESVLSKDLTDTGQICHPDHNDALNANDLQRICNKIGVP